MEEPRLRVTGQTMLKLGNYFVLIYKIENCLYRASASNGESVLYSELYVTRDEAIDDVKDKVRYDCSKKIRTDNGTY